MNPVVPSLERGVLLSRIFQERGRRIEAKPETLIRFRDDPYGFVMWAWPWGLAGQLERFRGPDEWQKEFLLELGKQVRERAFDGQTAVAPIRMTVSSGHGVGKAQPVDTVLETPSGPVRLLDIKPGDVVFGASGKPTIVLAVHERGIRPVFRVIFDDGSETRVCGEHLWSVRGRNDRRKGLSGWRIVSTQEILDRGVKRSNGQGVPARQWEIPVQGTVEFPFKWTPIEPYSLGVWLGDGHTSGRSYMITGMDPEIRDRMISNGQFCTKLYTRGNRTGKAFRFTIRGLLNEHMAGLGLSGKRSYEKFIPDLYKYNIPEIRAAVLMGLMDTDGTVDGYGSASYTTVSKRLAEDVLWLVRSLGGKARIRGPYRKTYTLNGKRLVGRVAYTVFVRMPDGFELFGLERKSKRLSLGTQHRYGSRWIDSIVPAGEAHCRCITVAADDGLYLTNDFIVTHNSSLAAWLTCWIMSTRPLAQGTVTANTFTQLEDKTWAAIQRWFNMSRTARDFVVGGSGIRHRVRQKAWKCTPQTCREENSEAFAGQHAATSTSFYIFDESSAVPERIWEVAEGGLSDGEPMIFAFGNPTRANGKFYRINFGAERDRWVSRTVDSRTCLIPNKRQIEEWREDYGEDSDFFRVRVRGLPPEASDMQYIDSARVYAAQKRTFEVLENEPLVAGVDLARGGGDKAVIRFRRGDDARTLAPIKIPSEQTRDSMLLVAKLADLASQTHGGQKVSVWFLDGGGVGGPIIDRMQQLGHTNFVEVQFGGTAPDPRHFVNMRAWMWSRMRDHLGTRLAIDKDKELETDLTGVGLGRPDRTDRIVLESKEDMKKRGMASPDDGDALALTYARPVAAITQPVKPRQDRYPLGDRSLGWMG